MPPLPVWISRLDVQGLVLAPRGCHGDLEGARQATQDAGNYVLAVDSRILRCTAPFGAKVEPGHRGCTQGVRIPQWWSGSSQMKMLPFCFPWKPLSLKVNHFHIEVLAFSLLGFCQPSRYTSNEK